jgi:hypothetical protein
MHVFLVSGVGNIQLQQTVADLRRAGVAPANISEYFSHFVLPKAHGVVNAEWFSTKRLGRPSEDDGWRGFSSELLSIVPIFLAPLGVMPEHLRCFRCLDHMLKLFGLGPTLAAEHSRLAQALMHEHGQLYRRLFSDAIKPKFHHMYHLLDHMAGAGKLLSCFVTERKHRTTKAATNHTYGSYEPALVRDMLNAQVTSASEESLFAPDALLSPSPARGPAANDWCCATRARLACGAIQSGDLVFTEARQVGEVDVCLSRVEDESVWIFIKTLKPLGSWRYQVPGGALACWAAGQVLEPLIWRSGADGEVLVLPPKCSVLWRQDAPAT